MESRRAGRRPTQDIIAPNEGAVFTIAKKLTPMKSHRKPLADRTNDSPLSEPVSEMSKGRRVSSVESTPTSKIHSHLHSSPPTQGEAQLQVKNFQNKAARNDSKKFNLHALLAEYCPSPEGLVAPTPANTPANVSSTASFRELNAKFRKPFAPFEEEAISALPDDSSLPAVSKDTHASIDSSGAVENEDQQSEDEDVLPLDMQLLYMFTKPTLASSPDDEEDLDPDGLHLPTLEHLEKVLYNMEEKQDPAAC